LAETENRDTDPKRKPRRIAVRLTRNLVLYYRQTASGAHNGKRHRDGYAQKIYQRTKNEAWTKPIETLGVIVVFAYTVFAGYQSCQLKRSTDAARKQTTLMRQQLIGSQAAILTLGLDFKGNGELTANFNNSGHVTAADVHIRIEGAKQKIASSERIGDPITLEYSKPFIKAQDGDSKTWLTPWRPHELTDKPEWPKGWPGQETFSFSGVLTYQNGFGDEIGEPFCWKWIPKMTITTKRQSSGGGGLIFCKDFDTGVRATQEAEKQAEEERSAPSPSP